MAIATTCSRVGCGEPAVASFGFDALACLVWLDPVTEPHRGAGFLCELHADRLTPLRGWNLLDRRGPMTRLWAERPPSNLPTPVRSRRDRALREPPGAAPPLPFDTALAAPRPSVS